MMKVSIQFRKKKDPICDLEQYFKHINRGFKRQISNLNTEHYFQNSRKQLYAFLNSAEKRIKKGEKKFLKQAWVKDIKKGKFLCKRTKALKYWYKDNSPAIYKSANQRFDQIEKRVENTFQQSRKWVGEKTPVLSLQFKKHCSSVAQNARKSILEYVKTLKKSNFKATIQLTIVKQ